MVMMRSFNMKKSAGMVACDLAPDYFLVILSQPCSISLSLHTKPILHQPRLTSHSALGRISDPHPLRSCAHTGERWHIVDTNKAIKKDRAKTQTFVYFELDGVDACVGGLRELYSDSEGASCLLS